jgi:hypothetical protein
MKTKNGVETTSGVNSEPQTAEAIAWKEIKAARTKKPDKKQSQLYLKIGDLKLIADEDYPVSLLAKFCKEMMA